MHHILAVRRFRWFSYCETTEKMKKTSYRFIRKGEKRHFFIKKSLIWWNSVLINVLIF